MSLIEKNEQPQWLSSAKMMTLIDKTSTLIINSQTSPDPDQLEALKEKMDAVKKKQEEVEKVIKQGYELQERNNLNDLIEQVE